MDPRIAEIEKEYRRKLPAFAPGDTVRLRVRVVEGDKERIQAFEGICIGRRGAGLNETFTLRRISGGVGVERIFPVHSPAIAGLEVVRRGDVRRAKLYYLRGRRGKRARVRERRWWLGSRDAVAEGAAEASDEAEAGTEAEAPADAESEAPEAVAPERQGALEDEGPSEAESAERRAAAEAAAE